MMFQASTLEVVWPMVLKRIMTHGDLVITEDGAVTRELRNIQIVIPEPEKSGVPKGSEFGTKSIAEYKDEMINPEDKGFKYTYGSRLRDYWYHLDEYVPDDTISDQVANIVDDLLNAPTTRRAVGVTWDPSYDPWQDDVPCMNHVQFFLRHGKLEATGLWRSHDIFGAYPANFFALLELSKYIAEKTESKVSRITTYSNSAHIYEHNFGAAERAYKNQGSVLHQATL